MPSLSRTPFILNYIFRNNLKVQNLSTFAIVKPDRVTRSREVPHHINVPTVNYPHNVNKSAPDKSNVKNDIDGVKQACILASKILNICRCSIKVGMTTDDIDGLVHEQVIKHNAYPSPLHYKGFPKSVCTSVNNVACHGIPDLRQLQDGDTLNVDVTVYLNGYHGDCSNMFQVGSVDDNAKRLITATKKCVYSAIDICGPNVPFCRIGQTIEMMADKVGFSVVPAFCGHGIGKLFHQPPHILHYANNESGIMKTGMMFTIEPVLSEGGQEIDILEDGWTAVMCDDSRTAQFEHTILITENGAEILTIGHDVT